MKISDALHVDTEGIKSCYSVIQSIFHFINVILQQPYFKSTEYDTPIPPGFAGNWSCWIYSMAVCFSLQTIKTRENVYYVNNKPKYAIFYWFKFFLFDYLREYIFNLTPNCYSFSNYVYRIDVLNNLNSSVRKK